METSPNAHVKKTAWRLAQENHASDPRLAQIRKPMGSKALELYEQARAATTPRAAQGCARLLRGGHRQLDAVGAGCRGDRAGAVLRGRSPDATTVRRR